MATPPLVLVHGLWDTPRLFNRFVRALDGRIPELLIPHLAHGLGQRTIESMASSLDQSISTAFGESRPIDILGFSMGGLISRTWIQRHGGYRRTRRFLCVGSPQRGTMTAQIAPHRWLPCIAEMKRGSAFLQQLEREWREQPRLLDQVDCASFYCRFDLMVVPSWSGVLPVGPRKALPVWSHHQLVVHPRAIDALIAALERDGSTSAC